MAMDELELLKKDWNNESENFRTYSTKDIYGMIRKKTMSITKILLLTGFAEAMLWTAFYYADRSFSVYRLIIFLLFFLLILYFYYRLNANRDVKELMQNIFRLRTIILGYAIISGLLIIFDNIINYKNYTQHAMAGFREGWNELPRNSVDPESLIPGLTGYVIFGIALCFVVFIIYSIYKRSYGNILHKLRANYKELTKLEESNA
ncbi:hypothetical protein CMU93_13905 [Elizabethkingia anophelis]|nr:hypothetical protein [Elizabethkingia anophelis]